MIVYGQKLNVQNVLKLCTVYILVPARNVSDLTDPDRLCRCFATKLQGPVVQKPANANLTLKINKGVLFSTPKCCSRLIFGKTLH